MHKIFDFPLDQNLTEFARYLWQQRIAHRILEREGRQELWLAHAEDAPRVLEAFERWRAGSLAGEISETAVPTALRRGLLRGVNRWPVTLLLLVLSVVLSLVIGFGDNEAWLARLSFVHFSVEGEYLIFDKLPVMLASGEYWRLITPTFLHFSLLHIVFNLLWTWELGRRIERRQPSWWLAMLVVFLGVLSNGAQFIMTGPLFGGLSGVVFGLMAYAWLWDRLNPERRFGLPPAIMVFMLVWLVVGVSGLLERFGFGAIANTAHLVGLLGGLVGAGVAQLIFGGRAGR